MMNRLPVLFFLFFFVSCLSGSEKEAQKKIREKYNAEEVRIHFPEEDINDSTRNIAEIIVINSPVLASSRSVFEDGLNIASGFYFSMDDKDKFDGVRVIISNPSGISHVSGFSKSFFYGKGLLRHE